MSEQEMQNRKNIGGQAVLEGVMMRGKKMYAVAVRGSDKEIKVVRKDIVQKRPVVTKLPIIRGVFAFVDSLVTGTKTLTLSAELAGLEDEEGEPSKFEKWLTKVFGEKLNDFLIVVSVVMAVIICVAAFMLLPAAISGSINGFLGLNGRVLGIAEGLIRIVIFVLYIYAISRFKDIQRVFEYHGAEHKVINCFESGDELTVENAKNHSRLHKRCGTSFLLIVMVISMIIFLFIETETIWLRVVMRIALVPVIAGLSYEIIKWAGMSDSGLVKIVSYPGMMMQKMTTREPGGDQLEVAIASLKEVLDND